MIFDHFPYLRKGLIIEYILLLLLFNYFSNTPKVIWKEGDRNNNNNINKICKVCKKTIFQYEDMTLIRDKYYYHDKCFNCTICHKSLINQTFRFDNNNNNILCLDDYYQNYGLKCHECNEIIKGKYIKLGNEYYYHNGCYCCYDCHTPFGKSPCYTMNIKEDNSNELISKNFCEKHYRLRNMKICKRCNQPIIDDYVKYKTDNYHNKCFKCNTCNCMLIGPAYLEKNGVFYCPKDYPSPQVCYECGTRIFRDPVIGLGKYHHKCCFKCDDCKRPFRGDYFMMNITNNNGNEVKNESLVLCQEDFQKRQGIID